MITIKDIAAELGISPSTVSRALKDHPDISIDTRNKVLELANKAKYRPNAIALSLKNRKSNVIGIIVPQIVHHFFSSVISGIDTVAHNAGYNVLISQSNESYEREIHNTHTLISSRVDGILVSITKTTNDYQHLNTIKESNIPMVFFDRSCEPIEADQVVIDDEKAAFEATEYLIKTGCKRILHFKGPNNLLISKKRLEGYLNALQKYNIPKDESLIIEGDTFDDSERITSGLIESQNLPDGIFTVNDMTALGAISALKKGNINIPEQVSVIGFTNGLISGLSDPPLTTIEQNGYLMGCKAAEMLLERIKNGKDTPPRTEVIPTKLIVRKTTF